MIRVGPEPCDTFVRVYSHVFEHVESLYCVKVCGITAWNLARGDDIVIRFGWLVGEFESGGIEVTLPSRALSRSDWVDEIDTKIKVGILEWFAANCAEPESFWEAGE